MRIRDFRNTPSVAASRYFEREYVLMTTRGESVRVGSGTSSLRVQVLCESTRCRIRARILWSPQLLSHFACSCGNWRQTHSTLIDLGRLEFVTAFRHARITPTGISASGGGTQRPCARDLCAVTGVAAPKGATGYSMKPPAAHQ